MIQEDYVRFKVYEEEGDDGTTKLKACEIAVEEDQEDWAWIGWAHACLRDGKKRTLTQKQL